MRGNCCRESKVKIRWLDYLQVPVQRLWDGKPAFVSRIYGIENTFHYTLYDFEEITWQKYMAIKSDYFMVGYTMIKTPMLSLNEVFIDTKSC